MRTHGSFDRQKLLSLLARIGRNKPGRALGRLGVLAIISLVALSLYGYAGLTPSADAQAGPRGTPPRATSTPAPTATATADSVIAAAKPSTPTPTPGVTSTPTPAPVSGNQSANLD